MTTTVTVAPAGAPSPPAAAPVSVSADLAKTYADAVAEAKAEILAAEAALKGGAVTVEGDVVVWFKANYQHVITWAALAVVVVPVVVEFVKHI